MHSRTLLDLLLSLVACTRLWGQNLCRKQPLSIVCSQVDRRSQSLAEQSRWLKLRRRLGVVLATVSWTFTFLTHALEIFASVPSYVSSTNASSAR